MCQVNSQTVDSAPGVKHSVFFDDVRIHESYLIGEERDGWQVTNATLLVEHGGDRSGGGDSSGAGVGIARSFIVNKFLEQCKDNSNVVKRLTENPNLVDSVIDIYIGAEIERLLAIKNTGGKGGRSGGPRLQLYSKMFGARLVADMANVLGPYAFTDDAEWGLDEGIFEVGQRSGICLAPGGTPEALKIVISRALAIGR